MRYTVPWLPPGRAPSDDDELRGSSILLAVIAGAVACKLGPMPSERFMFELVAALDPMFNELVANDDEAVRLYANATLLALHLGLIEMQPGGIIAATRNARAHGGSGVRVFLVDKGDGAAA